VTRKEHMFVKVIRKYAIYISDKISQSKINDMLLHKILLPNLCHTYMKSIEREKKPDKYRCLVTFGSPCLIFILFFFQLLTKTKNNNNTTKEK
jgi:hypothetical protein